MRPLRGERVVAGLGEVGDERGRGRLGLVVVVVVGDPLHRVRLGAATGLYGVSTPELNRAVEVMTFIVEPGATWAVSAKSLKPSLFAMARILPVEGWMTTIELSACMATAARAASSACGMIVVARWECCSGDDAAWLFSTRWLASAISTYRPGFPPRWRCLQQSRDVVSPASLYEVRSFPLASVTGTTWEPP